MNKKENNVVEYVKQKVDSLGEKFDKFRDNEFFHLKIEVRVALIISCAILGAILGMKLWG